MQATQQETSEQQQRRRASDKAEAAGIEKVLRRLYEVISFEEGGEPDWKGLEAVFAEQAHITRITPEGTDYLDRAGFLEMTRNLVEMGAYTSFYEFEVARQVQRYGDVAQVWSLYETRRTKDAHHPLSRGVNSIQLIKHGESSWQVLSLLWDDAQARPDLSPAQVFPEGSYHV